MRIFFLSKLKITKNEEVISISKINQSQGRDQKSYFFQEEKEEEVVLEEEVEAKFISETSNVIIVTCMVIFKGIEN